MSVHADCLITLLVLGVFEGVGNKIEPLDAFETFRLRRRHHIFEETMNGDGWNCLAQVLTMRVSLPLKVVMHAGWLVSCDVEASHRHLSLLGYLSVPGSYICRRVRVVDHDTLTLC